MSTVDHFDIFQTLLCIGDLFSGAKGIQTWLNLCARLISKSIPEERLPEAMAEHTARGRGSRAKATLPANRVKKEQMTSVVWTTPLGLPIVQPYRKTKRKQIMTALQTVYISDPNSPAEGAGRCGVFIIKMLIFCSKFVEAGHRIPS
jgi:DNA-directed RNA polymerase